MKIQKYQQFIIISSLTILLIVYIQFKKTTQARLAQQTEHLNAQQTNNFIGSNSREESLQEAPKNSQKNVILETTNESIPSQLPAAYEPITTQINNHDATADLTKKTHSVTITNGITKKDVAYQKMGTHHPEFETKINGIVVQPETSITLDTDKDHIDVTYSYTFKRFGRIIKQDTKTVACPLHTDNNNVILGFSWHKTPHIFLQPHC